MPPSETVPLAEGAGTPPRPKSGFPRQKIQIARLREEQNDYEAVLGDLDRLKQEYHVLEDAFTEVTQLNTDLAAELRQLKQQQRPTPVRFGQLLGGV